MNETQQAGLALLRAEFPAHQISKRPKPTRAQTDAVNADFKAGMRCTLCGAWHHKDVVHLDYVGHAALTDRLLTADIAWFWEPLALGPDGLPALDKQGGMWIRLTVCGVTRLGYGNANPKPNADAGAREKEVIGDALRNAAMRFGAALDLWHKGDLRGDDGPPAPPAPPAAKNNPPAAPEPDAKTAGMPESDVLDWIASVESMCSRLELEETRDKAKAACVAVDDTGAYARILAAAKKRAAQLPPPKGTK